MKTLKGKIKFLSLFDPIIIETEAGPEEIQNDLFGAFEKMNHGPAVMNETRDYFELLIDEKSDMNFHIEIEGYGEARTMGICIKSPDGVSWTNVHAYLAGYFQKVNSRLVDITVTDTGVTIQADVNEKVPELMYTGSGNCCAVSDDMIKNVCKAGCGKDTCIFLMAGGNGFECAKFDSYLGRQLLHRHSKNEMNAGRIGNCKVVGRLQEEKVENRG